MYLRNRIGWADNVLFGSLYESFDVLADRELTSSRREWRRHGEIRFVLARPASGTCASWSSRDDTTVLLALALPAESQTKSIHPGGAADVAAFAEERNEENSCVATVVPRAPNTPCECKVFGSRRANARFLVVGYWNRFYRSERCALGFSVAIVLPHLDPTIFTIFMQL